MAEEYKLEQIKVKPGEEDKIFFNFVAGGIRVEIHGYSEKTYTMKFTNEEDGKVHKTFENVKAGEFRTLDIEFYIQWKILVIDENDNKEVKNYTLDLENKNIFISYESSALGDTIAWMPYVEEFRKKHNCKIVCASFHNELFEKIYPEITFVQRGQPIQGIHVAYKLGWFGTGHPSTKNPNDCHIIPLQKVATDILGLPYSEIRPQLEKDKRGKLFKKGKYVVITTCSTAQFKYWCKPHAWQELIDSLVKQGYSVINIGKQPNFLKNVIDFTGKREMADLINLFQYADFFVGLPSGLAWLNWALGKKGVMITGISEAFCEYREDNYRAENLEVCHGCFNDPDYVFDKGDWLYCPKHKGTPKHFECTKEIGVDMVQNIIKLLISDIKAKRTHFSMSNEECDEYINGLDLEFKY